MTHYTDLKVYLGMIKNHGFGEGDFKNGIYGRGRGKWNEQKYLEAMQRVRGEIEKKLRKSEYAWLAYGDYRLVNSENDVEQLLDFSRKNMGNIEDIIELKDSKHGLITFRRKIRYLDYPRNKQDELIQKLMHSGIEPIDFHEIESAKYHLEKAEGYPETVAVCKSQLNKTLIKIWKEFLEFH